MECAICGHTKDNDEPAILSYRAFIQIFNILKKTSFGIECRGRIQRQAPNYICRECLLGVYQPSAV